jgi:hypothetical protein
MSKRVVLTSVEPLDQPMEPRTDIETKGEDISPAGQAIERAPSRTSTLIGLMRTQGGKSAAELAAAVGWQLHSVRGFISTLKKRPGLDVVVVKAGGVTRYEVRGQSGAQR